MPILETGLWILMAVMASAFTFFSLKTVEKTSIAFHLVAVALWMGLSAFHAGGYEVAATSTNMVYNGTGSLIENATKHDTLIPGGTTASWLAYLFLGFAIFNIMLVFKQVVKL